MSLDILLKYFDESNYPKNIAQDMEEDQLKKIGQQVCHGYKIDEDSRTSWMRLNEKAMKIAKQEWEQKDYPWEKASNVKFPLIPVGAISYASHSYPEIIRNGRVVEIAVLGEDLDGQKADRAKRVGNHMNYQLLLESDEWEVDQDRLSHVLPLIGHAFKKSYYSTITKRNCSELCLPDKIVVNNNIKSIETARRVTHILSLYWNDIVERINCDLYRDIDQEKLSVVSDNGDDDPIHEVLEQHCFIDLDKDGYQEPYIVLVHKVSEQVLAIYPRFDMNSIQLKSDKKTIKKIVADCCFTDFIYIPAPDGTYYGLGLGTLLYPINESINTLINQLVDSGTLSNMQGGFIGRGLKIKGGSLKFKMGEFQMVDDGGSDDIAKNIFPLPFKEPSPVLLQLLDVLIRAGKELATITDMATGQQDGQNVPATTAAILENSSMKMYSAAQRRMIRSLGKEFKKLYKLNAKYLDNEAYFKFNDSSIYIAKKDYEDVELDIKPIADPTIASQAQRLTRMQALMQMLSQPGVNVYEIQKRYLEELQIPAIEKILIPPEQRQPPPNPEMLKLQQNDKKMMLDANIAMGDQKLRDRELAIKEKETGIKAIKTGAEIHGMDVKAQTDLHYAGLDAHRAQTDRMKAQAAQAAAGRKVR